MYTSISIGNNVDYNNIGDVSLRLGDKVLSRVMLGNTIIHDIPSQPIVLASKILHQDSVKPLFTVLFLQNINGSPIIRHIAHIGNNNIPSIANSNKYTQRNNDQNSAFEGISYFSGSKVQFAVFDAGTIDEESIISISSYNSIGQSLKSEIFDTNKNSDMILSYDPLTSNCVFYIE